MKIRKLPGGLYKATGEATLFGHAVYIERIAESQASALLAWTSAVAGTLESEILRERATH